MDGDLRSHSGSINNECPTPAAEYHTEVPFVARLHTTSFSYDDHSIGILPDSIEIANQHPSEPQESNMFIEPNSITMNSKEYPRAAVGDDFRVREISEFVNPCGLFTFNITSSQPVVRWEDVRRNLVVTCALASPVSPAVSLRASSTFELLPTRDGVRVCISPAWWSKAATFTVVKLYVAGKLVQLPFLPKAAVAVVRVNHAPSHKGRLWESSKAGDAAGVISAIMDGCSIEELDEQVQ